jgi:hypothetical protein
MMGATGLAKATSPMADPMYVSRWSQDARASSGDDSAHGTTAGTCDVRFGSCMPYLQVVQFIMWEDGTTHAEHGVICL